MRAIRYLSILGGIGAALFVALWPELVWRRWGNHFAQMRGGASDAWSGGGCDR